MVSKEFADCFEAFDIGYSDFVRTTETRHLFSVCALWRRLMEKDLIYKGTVRAWSDAPGGLRRRGGCEGVVLF